MPLYLEGGSSSEDEHELRAVPTGTIRSRGGWNQDLELKHESEVKKDKESEDGGGDERGELIGSFQNSEVGSGYQAAHVVRQRNNNNNNNNTSAGSTASTKKKRKNDDSDDEVVDVESEIKRLREQFINSSELRGFKRTVDRILKSV